MSRRRKRYEDRGSVGQSQIVPFNPCEPSMVRHQRRLETNLTNKQSVLDWCATNGVTLQIKNMGHHWIFTKGQLLAEWWPSSAKLVVGKKYAHGIHVHDFQQAIDQLTKVFNA